MRAFDKVSGAEFDTSNEGVVIRSILSPIILEYQQVSDLLFSILGRYENDVDRYDRAVGSKRFMANLKIEFYKKWKSENEKLIQFVNLHHPTLRIERG